MPEMQIITGKSRTSASFLRGESMKPKTVTTTPYPPIAAAKNMPF